MIKCNIKFGKNPRVKAGGTRDTLTKDLMLIIKVVYEGMKNTNESDAEEFRKQLFAFLIDPNSPLFKNYTDSEQPENSPE